MVAGFFSRRARSRSDSVTAGPRALASGLVSPRVSRRAIMAAGGAAAGSYLSVYRTAMAKQYPGQRPGNVGGIVGGMPLTQRFNKPSGASLQTANIGFPAFGAIIENVTNQWYYVPDAQRFIPPYYGGVTIPLTGVTVGNLLCQAPASVTQAATINGESVVITFIDTVIPAGAGVPVGNLGSLSASRLEYFETLRNPVAEVLSTTHVVTPGEGPSNLGQIVNSTGQIKLVKLETLEIYIQREAVATAAGVTVVSCRYSSSSFFAANKKFLFSRLAGNTVGDNRAVYLTSPMVLQPGESIDVILDADTNTGGVVVIYGTAKWTDFDP